MMRIRIGPVAVASLAAMGLFSLAAAISMGKDSDDQRAAKGGDRADELVRAGSRFAEEGKYEDALARFEQANRERADDPEILNMLAYCQRKTGDLQAAFGNYARALELRPVFPQAREYLGEAHLQASLEQLRVLRTYGEEGAEESRLLADALRRAVAELGDPSPPAAAAERRW